jgi:hypothetical protein
VLFMRPREGRPLWIEQPVNPSLIGVENVRTGTLRQIAVDAAAQRRRRLPA